MSTPGVVDLLCVLPDLRKSRAPARYRGGLGVPARGADAAYRTGVPNRGVTFAVRSAVYLYQHGSICFTLPWSGKPFKRVTTIVGYGGSFVRGNTIFLNPLTIFGTLNYNYQRPYASIAIDIARGFTYKMAWNYYGFSEAGTTNPFGLATIQSQEL